LSPHVMQSRNSASNYSFNHTTLRFCLRKLVRTLVLGNTDVELWWDSDRTCVHFWL